MSGPARVESVNVGRPRLVLINGQPHKSGIDKRPVSRAVALRDDRVEGDAVVDRAVHGGYDKAVYAYALEDYGWWSGELGRELAPGAFGENLTTSGVDLRTVLVGERWRVGSALLEASEPRQPCSTLGTKMGDQRFVKRFARSLRLGAYLRIIEPGEVAPGSSIEVVERPDHGVTIALLGRVVFEDRSLGPEILAAGDALTDGWRRIGERLAAKQPRPATPPQ